jgi:putative DNA primase/helicase
MTTPNEPKVEQKQCPSCLAGIPEDSTVCPKCGSRLIAGEDGSVEAADPTKYFDGEGSFIPALLAEELIGKYNFVTMMDSQEVYIYLDGYYQPLGEVIIRRECKKRLQDEYRKNRAGEVVDYIKASTYTKRREESPNLLPLKNGVLDINTKELKPYTPEYMFFNKLPVNYDPAASCPEIKKFHKEIVNGEEDTTVLEEVIGFCLHRSYVTAKALLLVGGGSNGKSTWLGLVRTFLGTQNVCGRGLHDLEENRFAKADLFGKYANCCADLPDRALQRTGTFKMLTGGDILTAEKKFQHSFNFVNYAKLLFSANKVPEALDDTDAFFRRWIIITFPNVFNGENCDPYKLEKLITEQELSGLLNLALEALERILKNGGFSHMKSTEDLREDYVRKSSPIASFMADCLEVDSDAFIEKKSVYNVFAAYCREKAIPCVTQDTFFKNLPRHMAVNDFRPKVEGKRFTAFKGIRYSDAVSTLSGVSRVFFILVERAKDFKKPWDVAKLNDPSYIKIGLALDSPDSLDTAKPKPAVLTQENVEKVLNALTKAMYPRDSATTQEVAREAGLLEADVEAILKQLQREGKVYSPYPSWWKMV